MHGFVSYRCFGIVQLLRSDRALVRSRSLRARLLRSDRAVRVLGCYVATSSCAGQSLLGHKICSDHILASPSIDTNAVSSIDSPSSPRQFLLASFAHQKAPQDTKNHHIPPNHL
ncbi:hypothetical protein DY000_02052279 [Brassica cretica]|uniref:Uncharacterized protein n=1 Tax=Brassica cretica TaxID=69181 RepID=A0ABQ7AK87_BRACR|nr:hypothetical protein DY000_02052279 [Brassica cretica]